ncbi:Membrane protein insertase YidC [Planctomycetes bacterium Poly30]|uniref:Membrane protein insertase YidC n=1 Tax=Saltatorellus ferox TaxID=2528018 RepID=A0A518ES38_9BACT|nr:Membrane protein insertase YidC [Planctomycetes bacterium Poly30]
MGPEKRLPLALFLCFLVLMVVQLRNAPEPPAGQDTESSKTETILEDMTPGAPDDSSGPLAADLTPTDPAAAPATAPKAAESTAPAWAEWIEVGADGEIGHMWVLFDSYGGSIAEIRHADHFVRQGLTDEEKLDRANMVPIVAPAIEAAPPRTLQSLMLRPGVTAKSIFQLDPSRVHWSHERVGQAIVFTHEDPSGIILQKRIEHVPGQNHFTVDLSVRVTSAEHANKRVDMGFVASVGMPQIGEDNFYVEPKAVAALVDKDIKDVAPDLDGIPRTESLRQGRLAFFGTHNKYFAMLARPVSDSAKEATREANLERIFDSAWAADKTPDVYVKEGFRNVLVEGLVTLTFPPVDAPAMTYGYTVYAGPKDPEQFTEGDKAFNKIIDEDLGFFDGIAKLILGFMRFLHGIFGNWGWAIIFLTLTVRLMLFPLNRRMQTSMARHASKMKRVQPKIDAIKKKYADKPQQLRQEQAKIFQEEGVMPPLGGCLPMFLQIPIFFGLFSALRVSFDLRHQPFMGWIKDLSKPDRLAHIDLNTHLPFIGTIEWFNLLPILMVILWVAQQRVMPKPTAQDEQAKQMQKIMMWMPIMFGFFLYNYAAGLSLYMITTSAFGILESTVIRKIWPIDDTEQPKKKGKFMQRLEELQRQAEAQQRQKEKGKGKGGGGGKRK